MFGSEAIITVFGKVLVKLFFSSLGCASDFESFLKQILYFTIAQLKFEPVSFGR